MKKIQTIKKAILEIVLWVVSLIVLVPLAIAVLGAFKSQEEAVAFSLSLPTRWHLENFATVIEEAHIFRALLNSIFFASVSVVLTILFASMGAFVLARKGTKLADNLYLLFYIGLIMPLQTIPTISMLQNLHIFGTYASIIVLSVGINAAFAVFLYTGFFKSIPRDIDEAALIDGASQLQMFFKVVFPLTKPISVTIATLIFMGIWNDINIPLYFMNDSKMWTMPMTIYNFFGMYYQSWHLVFANIVLIALPPFILYVFSQRYLVAGLSAGAVKG